jgi:hypothetical protein
MAVTDASSTGLQRVKTWPGPCDRKGSSHAASGQQLEFIELQFQEENEENQEGLSLGKRDLQFFLLSLKMFLLGFKPAQFWGDG